MYYFILAILGLCIGSFIGAVVYRLHNNSTDKDKLSIVNGRSICANCGHKLNWYDLIPIFSWLSLKGKCRYCKKPIGITEILLEIITPILFILSYIYWPYSFNTEGLIRFIIWLLFLTGLIILFVYDIKWRLLPDKIVSILVGLVVIQIIIQLLFYSGGTKLIIGSLLGVAFSAGIFYGLFIYSSGKWIGGGDVKLSIALGLLVGGPSEAILMLFLASLIGCLYALPFLITHKMKKDSLVAFGPFLIIAATICYFFGTSIINWYGNLLG